ncbi:CDP-glycerol glycerophosphotransferase family protein [uncultured Sphaerochaeta sp.]|uniref:CDP-glycerol glycerophosphotransferase family protein n=1 Tax=uncultured Sphaerochaeta sp. TaxID=886478 RepID=UPI002AA76A2D|nr:CDP-glycerol glycerophosphotransferase family protein [uncultured Sphaerochaeta sp.]
MILCYIDPGTGSMLFSIVIGLVTMLYFLGKALWIKLKFVFTGGKATNSKNYYPLVIYSEGKRYYAVFRPILVALEKKGIPTMFFTSSEDDPVFNDSYMHIFTEYIGEGNKAFTRLNFLEADVCLMTTPGLDVYQLKRSRGVKHYSHVLHAVDDATSYRLFGLDYFDSVLLSGEYQKEHIRILEQKRGIKEKELVVVGCPYLDVLQEKVSTLPENSSDGFTVLVAPSWGKSGILSRYGSSLLDRLVETGFQIIVRPHPQSNQSEKDVLDELTNRYADNKNLSWDYSTENLHALSSSDIMISDFSGVIFDYTFLFDRPFLYVTGEYDSMPYDSFDIDEQPWKFRILPEIGRELKKEEFPRIKEILLEAVNSRELQDNRKAAKQTAWQYQGESGERIATYLASLLLVKNSDSEEMT